MDISSMILALSLVLGTFFSAGECYDPPVLEPGATYLVPKMRLNLLFWQPPIWTHSIYALTPTTYFDIVPDRSCRSLTPQLSESSTLSITPKKIRLRLGQPTVSRETAANLALRMTTRSYPYRRHRCNCRHYTDYLQYGRTFGTWWDPTYMLMSADCPLHGPLTSNSDVNSPTFKLYDRYGNPFQLGPPIVMSPPATAPMMTSPNPTKPVPDFTSGPTRQPEDEIEHRL